jgi:hypothetical protein
VSLSTRLSSHQSLLWLAMNDPATCDAILNKLDDDDAIDDPTPTPNHTAPNAISTTSAVVTTG